jgi:SAM-dependent methyltransferase
MTYMLTVKEEKIAQEWLKYQGYTVRPLPSTLSYYGEIIASHSEKTKALIYGGTPELRSIFQKLRYPVTLVDRSETMVSALGSLTEAQRPFSWQEQFVACNWLAMSKLERPFDLLIGDDAINMVAWPQFEVFLQQASSLLRKGGLFICHLLVKPSDDLIYKPFSRLRDEWQERQIKSKYDLASYLNFLCWDPRTYSMGWQQTIETLGQAQLAQFKPDFDFIDLFGLCNSQFACPPLSEFESLVERYFSIKEIFYPQEHDYCRFEPIYVLEKE